MGALWIGSLVAYAAFLVWLIALLICACSVTVYGSPKPPAQSFPLRPGAVNKLKA